MYLCDCLVDSYAVTVIGLAFVCCSFQMSIENGGNDCLWQYGVSWTICYSKKQVMQKVNFNGNFDDESDFFSFIA